jgi:hypothetical protein
LAEEVQVGICVTAGNMRSTDPNQAA